MSKIDDFAKEFADAVRDAFVDVYGRAPNAEAFEKSVVPTWSDKGVAVGWQDNPDPRVALVFTERGWIRDPWTSSQDHRNWEKAAEILMKADWGNVRFDSINPAVHIVFIDIPDPWIKTLMERAMEKGKGR